MEDVQDFRLIQDGQVVAGVSGPGEDVRREIVNYAAVYLQDGPVRIEQKVGTRWQTVEREEDFCDG